MTRLFEREERPYVDLGARVAVLAVGHVVMLVYSWTLLRSSVALETCEPAHDNCDPSSFVSSLAAMTLPPVLVGLFAKRLFVSGIIALMQAGSPILSSGSLDGVEGMFDFLWSSIAYAWILVGLLSTVIVALDRSKAFGPTLM